MIRDSSARMSSYWRSRYPTISPKLKYRSVLLLVHDMSSLGKFVGRHALLRCRFGHRNRGYQQWLGKSGFLRHPTQVLVHTLAPLASFAAQRSDQLTNGDRLDADSLLNVGVDSIISILGFQHLLSTECVDESRASCDQEMR